jgi:opacity protein-like surface antigen
MISWIFQNNVVPLLPNRITVYINSFNQSMRKFFITMCVALLSMSALAQEKGDFAVGVRGGVAISKIKIEDLHVKETSSRFGIGAFGQYNLTNHFRFDLEAIYHPKKDHVSDFQLGLDIQYLVNITDELKFYPMVGYTVAFVHTEAYTKTVGNGTIVEDGENSTDSGIQIGAGLQYNLGSNWFISGEYRFQPGIIGDCHVIMGSVGYRF